MQKLPIRVGNISPETEIFAHIKTKELLSDIAPKILGLLKKGLSNKLLKSKLS
jgi:hypothetical protein